MLNELEQKKYMNDLNDIVMHVSNDEFANQLNTKETWYNALSRIYDFRAIYYKTFVWTHTKYMGIEVMKSPNDMWVMQEIIYEVKPTLIIETGTWYGGSALYYAHLLDALERGQVISIDNDRKPNIPIHPRIHYIYDDCLSYDVTERIKRMMNGGAVLVSLDSDHNKDHVLKEMNLYSQFVTQGSYLVVDDTMLCHPIRIGDKDNKVIDPGPMEAVMEFLEINKDFEIDKTREKFLQTFNPNGYLRRKS